MYAYLKTGSNYKSGALQFGSTDNLMTNTKILYLTVKHKFCAIKLGTTSKRQ